MTADRTFVDTNVLVYAYDQDAGPKRRVASELLRTLWQEEEGAISTQVLQEFYVTVTRKVAKPLSPAAARDVLQTYEVWKPHRPDAIDLVRASEVGEHHSLSFWDALIVVSAGRAGAVRLASEDLQDGRRFDSVEIYNPFG
jgi:predicted nucleic acid-binding protein